MRSLILLIFITFCHSSLDGQHASKVNITSEEFEDRIEIYATNGNPIPVSVKLEINSTGLDVSSDTKRFKTLESNEAPILVTTLKKTPGQGWSYRYNMQVYLGNFYSDGHDDGFVYTLPFPKGASFLVSQGYGGEFSHRGENAIDFVMKEGSEVMAMRDGVVAEVKEDSKSGCPNRSCLQMANSILIYHSDGTFARYAHLKYSGAMVEVGQKVEAGELIGYSGNTGWSSEPHLHFSIFELKEGNQTHSIPTKFMTEEGVAYLEEKRFYTRPE